MKIAHVFLSSALAICTASGAATVNEHTAVSYPQKPIKLVVGYAPGGTTDVLARLIGRRLQETLGQPVVVENRPGNSGIVAASLVSKANPDGYTLLIGGSGQIVFNAAVNPALPFSPQRDLVPISSIATFPLVLSVAPSSQITSLPQLVAYTKANPKLSNYASSAAAFQLASELLKQRTGIVADHVPYKGSTESMNAVVAGDITFTLLDTGTGTGALNGHLLRGLAITADKRLPQLPEIPTFKEQGVDFSVKLWTGLFAPANTPAAIVQLLEREVSNAVTNPETVKSMTQVGLEPKWTSSADFSLSIGNEIREWTALARQRGIEIR